MSGLFPKPPKLPDPAPMPDRDSPAAREAAQRRQAQISSRGGRSSTILSEGLMQTAGKMGA